MKLPVFFMGHGAAILSLNENYSTNKALTTVGREEFEKIANLDEVKCIIVISAHYETSHTFTIGIKDKPATIHDHPARDLYHITYNTPVGAKEIGLNLFNQLTNKGIKVLADERKDLDHGSWLPPLLLYPNPTKPILPLSILSNHDIINHVEFGESLSSLREEGYLFIGSGGLTHNQQIFRENYFAGIFDPNTSPDWNNEFEDNVITSHNNYNLLSLLQNKSKLTQAHPTLDHLLPFCICSGLGGRGSKASFVSRSYQPGLSTSLLKIE